MAQKKKNRCQYKDHRQGELKYSGASKRSEVSVEYVKQHVCLLLCLHWVNGHFACLLTIFSKPRAHLYHWKPSETDVIVLISVFHTDQRIPGAGFSSWVLPWRTRDRRTELGDWDGLQLRSRLVALQCLSETTCQKGRVNPGLVFYCGLGESKAHEVSRNSSLDALICKWSDWSPLPDPNIAD